MKHLVNFFIVGVQKGGTTTLFNYLRRNPGLQMSKRKEIHYFDDETVDWNSPTADNLHSQFDWSVSGVLRGEATPIYIYWPDSLARLHSYNPQAKLIVVLRHPVHRAFSHWRMETERGLESLPFDEAVQFGRERVRTAPKGAHRVFSYVERGFYSHQLERLFAHFPRNQIHFLRTDALWQATAKVVAGAIEFIGVQPQRITPETRAPRNQSKPLTAKAKALLMQLYEGEIRETSRLTGLELSDWLSDEYCEPMYVPTSTRNT